MHEKPQLQEESYHYLTEIQKWSRFLSIAGFVLLGLGVLFMVLFAAGLSQFKNPGQPSQFEGFEGMPELPMQSFALGGVFILIIYLIGFVITFIPLLYLFRFSTRLKNALQTGNDQLLTNALESLKKHYKFLGILLIIVLVFYIMVILFSGLGFLLGSFLTQ